GSYSVTQAPRVPSARARTCTSARKNPSPISPEVPSRIRESAACVDASVASPWRGDGNMVASCHGAGVEARRRGLCALLLLAAALAALLPGAGLAPHLGHQGDLARALAGDGGPALHRLAHHGALLGPHRRAVLRAVGAAHPGAPHFVEARLDELVLRRVEA